MRKLRVVAALAAGLVVAGVASASSEPPIKAQGLAAVRIDQPISIKTSKPGNVLFVKVTVMPGGDFGWHFHRSPVVAAVTAGTLTLYDSADPKCAPRRVSAGSAFTEARTTSIWRETTARNRCASWSRIWVLRGTRSRTFRRSRRRSAR